MSDDRKKALEAALAQIEKRCGRGSVMTLGGKGALGNVDAISTGSLAIDLATGIRGLPRGRIVEIYGPESSGKTTLALEVAAQVHAANGEVCFIDAEHALDPGYAAKLGVDVDRLVISQPDHGEQALEIAEIMVRSQALDLVVVDSVAALVPRAEIEGDMGDQLPGLQARLMSQALRKLTAVISSSNTCVIFVNQIRHKIGVMFGSPETTTGGNALKFYASMRLDIRRIGAVKERDEVIGNQTRVRVVKNKLAPPFRIAETQIHFGRGFDQAGELIDLGTAYGVVEKAGAWFSFQGERLGQGRSKAGEFLCDHPATADSLRKLILKAAGFEPEEENPPENREAANPERSSGQQGTSPGSDKKMTEEASQAVA